MEKFRAAFEAVFEVDDFLFVAGAAEPSPHTFLGDGVGEAFVECALAFAVKTAVGELVEDEFGDGCVAAVDEGIQDRVCEESERGIRAYLSDVGIVAECFQLGGVLIGVGFGKMSAVTKVADDWESPSLGTERIFGCCEDAPDYALALKVDVFGITSTCF